MIPTEEEIISAFENALKKKKINIKLIDEKWLGYMMVSLEMCDFETEELFMFAVNHIVDNIPPKQYTEELIKSSMN